MAAFTYIGWRWALFVVFSITLIAFAPALFNVQRLKNSANPLGFYGAVMGLLSASYQH